MDKVTEKYLVVDHPTIDLGCGACKVSITHEQQLDPEVERKCNQELVNVLEITQSKEGWEAKGVGIIDELTCRACGMMYDNIRRAIPIQCMGIVCSSCGSDEKLDVKVNKIEKKANTYEFEASYQCTGCNRVSKYREMISNIFTVFSINVSATGIEFGKK